MSAEAASVGEVVGSLRAALSSRDALAAAELAATLERLVVGQRAALDAATRAAIADCDRLAADLRAELERALTRSNAGDRALRAYGETP